MSMSWCQRSMRSVVGQTKVLLRILKHPRAPWHARLIAGSVLCYLFSPVQLIPTFIPVIGQADDLAVIFIGMKLVQATVPREILLECRKANEVLEQEDKENPDAAATCSLAG